jgi:hypothetical protein
VNDKAQVLDSTLQTTVLEDDAQVVVRSYQDVEPHLEYCERVRRVDAEDRGAFGKHADFHQTMSVPFNVILEIAQKLGISFANVFDSECQKRIIRELKSGEYKRFRTTNDKNI